LADWFIAREDVKKVYYPKFTQPKIYSQLMNHNIAQNRHKPGFGGLMSLILQDNLCSMSFYDHLDCAKGPSLGTNFTLVCPYTLLAHYHELEFARIFNVQANLIRVAIGLEPVSALKNTFSRAFDAAKMANGLQRQQRRAYSNCVGSRYNIGSSFGTLSRTFLRGLPK